MSYQFGELVLMIPEMYDRHPVVAFEALSITLVRILQLSTI